MPALLRETVDLLHERLVARGVAVEWSLPEATPAISGSDGELQQVFTNLLLNAIDAAPERGGRIEIAVEAVPCAGAAATVGLRVRMEDNGSGIEAQHLAKVFEPFYTTKTGKGGTGLGLAISRSIIEQHGGRIQVESRGKDLGCRFVVDLPTAGNAARAADAAQERA